MQVACNRTTGAHPFDFVASSMEAQTHMSCNRRAGHYVKGRTAMQVACNRTTGAHPFDFVASSMEAQTHMSCNRRAGHYVRETAPPLAPMPRLHDCGTSAVTRGNPAHGPTVPTEHIGHGSVSRGRRRDGRYGQKWAGSNGGSRRAEAAVKLSAGSRPLLEHAGEGATVDMAKSGPAVMAAAGERKQQSNCLQAHVPS